MAIESKIEWTDATFNPWIGCTKISPACDHCYASVSTPTRRFGVKWGAGEERRRTAPSNWQLPLRWNAQHDQFFAENGRRRRVFCASLADVFDNEVDPAWRADLFALIEATPNLDWLLLTKRIGNVAKMAPAPWVGGPVQHGPDPANIHGGWPANVWLGATICNQAEADRDIPKLLATRAAVKFLSMEPLLGEVDLAYPESLFPNGPAMCCSGHECGCAGQPTDPPLLYGLDWVIVGGESGHGARPMNPTWARLLRDQCAAYRVPFLFKQWGEWVSVSEVEGEGPHHQFPTGETLRRIGKHAAGRTLDGALHDGYPHG
ncbi:hypothetical protein [Xanthomonas phage MET23-P3]|nr:hypothetical protein [Xanthomonas phage MET23-P3]